LIEFKTEIKKENKKKTNENCEIGKNWPEGLIKYIHI